MIDPASPCKGAPSFCLLYLYPKSSVGDSEASPLILLVSLSLPFKCDLFIANLPVVLYLYEIKDNVSPVI